MCGAFFDAKSLGLECGEAEVHIIQKSYSTNALIYPFHSMLVGTVIWNRGKIPGLRTGTIPLRAMISLHMALSPSVCVTTTALGGFNGERGARSCRRQNTQVREYEKK